MKKLKVKAPYNHHIEYRHDIQRIVEIFASRGYEISESDAVVAWEIHDEEIFNSCFLYFEE